MIRKILIDSAGDVSIFSTGEEKLWMFLSAAIEPKVNLRTAFHKPGEHDTIEVQPEDLRLALRVLYQMKAEAA